MLFPHLAGLRVERVFTRGRSVRIAVGSEAGKAACPGCGVFSARVHSRYERRLADVAVGGQELMIQLKARRFLCESSSCPRKTFAERFPELAVPYGRRRLLLRRTLETIALALGTGASLKGGTPVAAVTGWPVGQYRRNIGVCQWCHPLGSVRCECATWSVPSSASWMSTSDGRRARWWA